ncbi:hypothetical protein ACFQY5_11855 [Paeniroseomonas aquatica]|uniref:hypothetical protein n=1 Tax=Paeniroseomonas aquatica TaxID=373043 RepID=UPI00361321EA
MSLGEAGTRSTGDSAANGSISSSQSSMTNSKTSSTLSRGAGSVSSKVQAM